MNTNEYYADEIMRRVDMLQATQYYGLAYNRMGFASCPFHSERSASFKVNGAWGHCFGGCGWNGNIIQFVRKMFNLSFTDALVKINSDFNLCLPIGRKPTLREQRDAQIKQREFEAERAKREAEKQAYDTLYNALWGEFTRLDKQRMIYKPTSADDELDPLYVEAVSNISNVCYRIDTLL